MKYHFFGKDCVINQSWTNLEILEKKLQEAGFEFEFKPLLVNQIHGDQVIVVDQVSKIYPPVNLPKADALVTNIKNLPICIITADCAPIIFVDEKAEIIGIAHAGWKGAKKGIIENTVNEMIKLGAKIENIQAKIGPTIAQKSYEVGEEFFEDFIKENSENSVFFKQAKQPGKYNFDLPAYCISRLKKAGIRQIQDNKIDTYSNEEILFSFRRSYHRNEQDCGRNIGVVMLN